MYYTMLIEDLQPGQAFVYDSQWQIVVKAEPNLLGQYDVWFRLKNSKSKIATGHLVTEANHVVLVDSE